MMVEGALLRAGASLGTAEAILSRAGLWAEAVALSQRGRLAWAEQAYLAGSCLSAHDDAYPARLLALRESAPPALWQFGALPAGPGIGIVGSRRVSSPLLAFAAQTARAALDLGYHVISGGAAGCDSAAAQAATGQVVEILPYGLHHHRSPLPALTLCAPSEPFSASSAMERNALIYAASQQVVVVHTRFREGGTWAGASEAIRRKRCPVLVRHDPLLAGHRALLALGARPLVAPDGLAGALGQPPAQPVLMPA
jgi:predicted Rossmann fold nucleotide-binding protein DprA/Smf involved in DNA uptake